MERWLLTVESNAVDPSREKELNEWYDSIHQPDIRKRPGYLRAAGARLGEEQRRPNGSLLDSQQSAHELACCDVLSSNLAVDGCIDSPFSSARWVPGLKISGQQCFRGKLLPTDLRPSRSASMGATQTSV